MKQTEHYGLNLPEDSDYAQIEQLNANTRIIDAQLEKGVSALAAHDVSAQAHQDLRRLAQEAAPMKDVYTRQETDARIAADVAAHNLAADAHPDIRSQLRDHQLRVQMLEDFLYHDITGNPHAITFVTLDGLIVTGVWNEAEARLEC